VNKQAKQVTSEDLRTWLADLDANEAPIIAAIQSGAVQVTTAKSFSDLADRAKKCNDYAKAYADAELRLDDEQTKRILYQNTAYYLLKAFEGIARKSPQIIEIMNLLGIMDGKELGAKQIASLALSGNLGKVIQNGREVVAGLDVNWLKLIQIGDIADDMKRMNLPLEGYDTLLEILNTLQTQPKIHGGDDTKG
jgi:hypothetical protein